MAARSGRGAVLVFDEIQKIERWSEAVKGLWDADRARDCPLHVIILGSAPMSMQAGPSESLAGRFQRIPVTHWSFAEMSAAFSVSLEEYLCFGGYPRGAAIRRDPDQWRDYILQSIVESHLERDLLSMTRVDKPALLKRLFELGAEWSGQVLAYNKMLGQLQDAVLALAEKNGWGTHKRIELDGILRQLPRLDINREAILNAYALFDAWTHGKSVTSPGGSPPKPAVSMAKESTDRDFLHLRHIWFEFIHVDRTQGSVVVTQRRL